MGRSLEEIEQIFRESPSILGTVKYARNFAPRDTDNDDEEHQKIGVDLFHDEKIQAKRA